MAAEIKFGTDGWRGVIADDYTFENVRRVAGAIAAYILKHEDSRKGLVIGYDTRFGSRRFAELVAETAAGAGIPVTLGNDYTPTPAVSFAVRRQGAAGGVVITSSHNPWNWNGVKYKASYGGSATPPILARIEEELAAGSMPKGSAAAITEADLTAPYVEAIKKFVDLERIRRAGFRFAVDCMYGAGRGVLAGILQAQGMDVREIRAELNPLFPGINPEPIEPHVALLQETVRREGCHAGLATDGDADRIGAVAEDGSFVDAHKIFSIL
ncbi:MAG: phosphoglucomutase/phosphomannomutase family protein, partial [Acidobacteria bacterium]|nr:phosphoglucomutase/phosphomannomutase family protein [Acidobacteriota bacterium]